MIRNLFGKPFPQSWPEGIRYTSPLKTFASQAKKVVTIGTSFLAKFNRSKNKAVTIEPAVVSWLETYAWPGNVRELEHLIEVLVVTAPSDVVTTTSLPEKFTKAKLEGEMESQSEILINDLKVATKKMTTRFEREFILKQLEKHRWNITQTAQTIGLSRAALHTKMKDYAITNDSDPQTD